MSPRGEDQIWAGRCSTESVLTVINDLNYLKATIAAIQLELSANKLVACLNLAETLKSQLMQILYCHIIRLAYILYYNPRKYIAKQECYVGELNIETSFPDIDYRSGATDLPTELQVFSTALISADTCLKQSNIEQIVITMETLRHSYNRLIEYDPMVLISQVVDRQLTGIGKPKIDV